MMLVLSKKEDMDTKFETARKVYECYRFLVQTVGPNEVLRQKIDALAEEHLLSLPP
ncbi:MAG TPA: hypothetical protein VLH35_01805 [Candidatus Acidoferrales bacterium]|nr:hypothetical protein [Candidatus Acidoferrales bacterium]